MREIHNNEENGERILLEKAYLDKSREIIQKQLDQVTVECAKGIEEVHEMSKYHWENKSEMDDVERASSRYSINFKADATNRELEKRRNLEKSLKNAFFGKMVLDYGDGPESLYVGLYGIMDNYEMIIHDWRCDVANMFYDAQKGETSGYRCPLGFIEAKLLQRSQIKVQDDQVLRVIDTDTHIADDELQEVLSQSSSDKMKEISRTIQYEQNEVIRNTKDKKIVVQGCAGSGKTSVALHRLAYLLYHEKNLSSRNMLIFSPSDAFSSYISNVLPELHEENVLQTTFSDFANAFVTSFNRIESYTEFVSRHYDGLNSEEEEQANRFKFSEEYKNALDAFIKRVTNSYSFKKDFSFKNLYVPEGYMNKLLKGTEHFSLQEKIDTVTDAVLQLYKDKSSIVKSVLRNKVARDLVVPQFNPRVLYNKFVESEEYVNAFGKKGKKLTTELLEYPDLIGLLYLNFEMMGYPDNNVIHHLVIDEAQDYAPLQAEMIAKMFNGASITALGDANQTINPYHKYESLIAMKKIFGVGTRYLELNKAYRSSPEIMDYTNGIIEDANVTAVRNSNSIPVAKKEVSKDSIFTELVKDILALQEAGFKKICVITKSSNESKAIYEGLKDHIEGLAVLTSEDIPSNTLVAPSYLAKGLEFDAVISYNDYDNPYGEDDKYLYYVTCTRAQHNLVVYNEPKALKKTK